MADENKAESATPLSDLFDGGSSQSPGTSSAPAVEESSTTSEGEPETSPEDGDKPAEGSEEKPTEVTDDPNKVAETPAALEKKAAEKKVLDEKVAAEKVEADKVKYDSAENPFKKRFEDTAAWARQINGENLQLRTQAQQQQAQLNKLQKMVDGTWTEDDEAAQQPGNTAQDIASNAERKGKAIASHAAAVERFGPESVRTNLEEFHQLFNGNQAIQHAVAESPSPVFEALSIMKRYHFEQKWGSDPDNWAKAISESAVKDETAKLRKSILEEIKAGKSTKEKTPGSLSATPGSAGNEGSLREEAPTSLKELFG